MPSKTWREHLSNWRASGLSRAEYCRQRSLNKNTFAYWLRREREESNKSGSFVRVGNDSPVKPMELVLENGITLKVPNDFDPDSLRTLLEVLR